MNPMDYISAWQAALAVSMGLSFIIGRPRFSIIAVMLLNFCATMAFAAEYPTVMVVDVLCAAALMGRGARADFVALLFALMVPIYIPAIIGGWEPSTTYAIIEVLSYLQIAIIGGVGRGYVSRYFGPDYFPDGTLRPAQERGHHFIPCPPHNGKRHLDEKGHDLD